MTREGKGAGDAIDKRRAHDQSEDHRPAEQATQRLGQPAALEFPGADLIDENDAGALRGAPQCLAGQRETAGHHGKATDVTGRRTTDTASGRRRTTGTASGRVTGAVRGRALTNPLGRATGLIPERIAARQRPVAPGCHINDVIADRLARRHHAESDDPSDAHSAPLQGIGGLPARTALPDPDAPGDENRCGAPID